MTPDIYKRLEELEARMGELESEKAKDNTNTDSPLSPLVRKLALTMRDLNGGGDQDPEELWHEDAKQVLLDIADWLKVESEDHHGNGKYWASRLKKEADPSQDLHQPGVTLAQISEWVKAQEHAEGSYRYEWTKRVEHHDAMAIAAAALHDLGKV